MAHYAFLDESNIVIEVISGIDEDQLIEETSPEKWYEEFRGQKCIRTSYNSKIRKNFAGIGYYYDEKNDYFISPKPFESWTLNKDLAIWEPPISRPEDNNFYDWNENAKTWDKV
jgi:hypothetical protein